MILLFGYFYSSDVKLLVWCLHFEKNYRLRKEIQERESKGLGPLLNGESAVSKKESDFEGTTFYEHVKKWVLTDEELDIHGYPKESGTRGKAIINNRTEISHRQFDDNYRKCCRYLLQESL